VIGRLRALLERPLDPDVASAVVSLGLVATVGLACLFCVAACDGGEKTRGREAARAPAGGSVRAAGIARAPVPAGPGEGRRQDRQDRPGTVAHRRAERELAAHRALQHVPWRQGAVSVALVGARGSKAVLAVRASTLAAARRGWRRFLRRFDDPGLAYLPRFGTEEARRG
jgi:hypothetical protein